MFGTSGFIRSPPSQRVVLSTATDGAAGEVPDGLLILGESFAERRRTELEKSAGIRVGMRAAGIADVKNV